MGRRRKKNGGFIFLFIVLVVVIALIVVLFKYNSIKHYNEALDPANTNTYSITVKPGMSSNSIAKLLQEQGIIKDAEKFRLRAKLLKIDQTFMAGEYQLSPSMNIDQIYYELQNATRETVNFTIPEGLYIRQVAKKLLDAGLISSVEDFYSACEDDYDYDFIPSEKNCSPDPTSTLSARANRLEGYLFPNTYQVYKNASAHDIIDKMLSGFNSIYTEDYQKKAKELGYSNHDIIIIASLIERETKVANERAKVSSVIYNRLNLPMNLQFCSSVQYSLGENKTRLLYKDLEVDTKYNTYKNSGLPIGPIASPGQASIEAALNPEDTDYLYFVLKANKSGEHNFAKSSSEFSNYKQDYLNALE